jgi:hypothetical protein
VRAKVWGFFAPVAAISSGDRSGMSRTASSSWKRAAVEAAWV